MDKRFAKRLKGAGLVDPKWEKQVYDTVELQYDVAMLTDALSLLDIKIAEKVLANGAPKNTKKYNAWRLKVKDRWAWKAL